jgi:acylphosphatase
VSEAALPAAVRRRVVVRGLVQGVGFRVSCARRAQRLGLAGAVRNCPDGTVEAAFEGPPDAVEAMVAWCRQGPPMAEVSGVEVLSEEPRGERGFRAE